MNWSPALRMAPSWGVLTIPYTFIYKLVLQRHLLWTFVVRDLRSRYIGSFMGFFWSVIHPLVLLVSYYFVFSVVFNIRPNLERIDNFAVFLFCGIIPWLFFQDSLMRSCTSVVDNGNLIRKTVFPSQILPVVLVLSNLVTHLVGFTLLLAVLLFLGVLGWTVLLIPMYLIFLVLLSLGLGWTLAALQVFFRDTSQILSVVMVFWFWFTPIFYQIEIVPQAFQPWIQLNPMSHVVLGYRRLLLEARIPDANSLLWLAVVSVIVFLAGGVIFRIAKRDFADVL